MAVSFAISEIFSVK